MPSSTGLQNVRLATLAVYHFDANLKPLVELHLERLRRNCPQGTVFYGAAIRLNQNDRGWLRDKMGVRLPDLPELPEGHRAEHNGALDALAEIAFADGATHVATFHQDSFPIKEDWLTPVLRDLNEETVVAAAEPKAFNCCMVWDRRWQDMNFKMLLSEEDRSSEAFQQFRRKRPDLDEFDGGIGHLFGASSQGFHWRALTYTGKEVLADSIFHMTGATRLVHKGYGPKRNSPLAAAVKKAIGPLRRWIPRRAREVVGALLKASVKDWEKPIGSDGSASEKRTRIDLLVADPDIYIEQARKPAETFGSPNAYGFSAGSSA